MQHFRDKLRLEIAVHWRLTLCAVLMGSFLLKLHHLDHASLKPLDEVFHAIVSRNFLKHPLTPALVDPPLAGYDYRDWQGNYIWLHKPPMAMWQIALSFAALGVKTFSLRLPSAILSTLAVWLTYLIGAELLDRTAGLIAAAMQAFNPVILMLVNGYIFSDHVDISLLFWCEFGIYFLARALHSGKWTDLVLCGAGQGCAFLSKSYPALIVLGVALVAWMLPRLRRVARDQRPLRGKSLAIIIFAAALVALPWNFYAAIRFPDEFRYENLSILSHLDRNVEGWAAPWDRVVFGYWISIFHVFYPAVLAAGCLLLIRAAQQKRIAQDGAAQQKQIGLWLVLAWAVGGTIPHLLATSKTMSATLPAWPAGWLLLGYMISLALRGDGWALATWTVSMLGAALFLTPDSIPSQGGFGPADVGAALRQNQWVIWHVLAALVLGAILARILQSSSAARMRPSLIAISAALMLLLAVRWWKGDHPPSYVAVAWKVTQINRNQPDFAALGAAAAKLPANAALIVIEQDRLDNKLIQFAADRSCYALRAADWHIQALALADAGGVPYLVTAGAEPLPVLFVDAGTHYTLYACSVQGQK